MKEGDFVGSGHRCGKVLKVLPAPKTRYALWRMTSTEVVLVELKETTPTCTQEGRTKY